MRLKVTEFFLTSQNLMGAIVQVSSKPWMRVCLYYSIPPKKRKYAVTPNVPQLQHTIADAFPKELVPTAIALGVQAMQSDQFLSEEIQND